MHIRTLFLSIAAATVLIAGSASAEPPHGNQGWQHDRDYRDGNRDRNRDRDWRGDRNRDRDWRDDRGNWHRDRDRYWRNEYGMRGFVPRDRIFRELRRRNYVRFTGDPYWFQGRYVIRTFDRRGQAIIVEINPYTGDVMGIVRF